MKFLVPAFTAFVFAATAHASIIFSDNFNESDSSVNQQLNAQIGLAGRQGGTIGTTSYSQDFGFAGYANPGPPQYNGDNFNYNNVSQIYVGAANFFSGANSPNYNFTDSGNLKISFDLFLQNPGTGQSGVAFFSLGASAQTDLSSILSFEPARYLAPGFNLTVTSLTGGNEQLSFYDGSTLIGSSTFLSNNSYPVGMDAFVISLNTPDAYDGSGTATIGLTINGNVIDLNGAGAGTTYSGTGLTSNFINFGGNAGNLDSGTTMAVAYDNLVVEAVPEPGAIGLCLVAAVGLVVIHRRRSAKLA